MNNVRRGPKPKVPNPKFGICVICGCLLFLSCFRLDSFLFDAKPVTEYLQMSSADSAAWHVRGIIPDSLVEPETLVSQPNGNKVYGFFVRQPGDCPRMGTVPRSPTEGVQSQSAGTAGDCPQGPVQSTGTVPGRIPGDQFTVIYNHGNGQNINRYWGRVELLWEAGCNVFIYDYEGFGKSEGSPSGNACYADADAALAYVLARPDVVDSNIVYYGWSLGSFMACHLAADDTISKPRCLILENPMASTSALAKEGAVLAIPGSFVADADFDNEARIPFVGCRTLIIYGKKDDTAVPRRNAEVLLAEAQGWIPITDYPVENANHADLPEVMTYPEYERVITAFIRGDTL